MESDQENSVMESAPLDRHPTDALTSTTLNTHQEYTKNIDRSVSYSEVNDFKKCIDEYEAQIAFKERQIHDLNIAKRKIDTGWHYLVQENDTNKDKIIELNMYIKEHMDESRLMNQQYQEKINVLQNDLSNLNNDAQVWQEIAIEQRNNYYALLESFKQFLEDNSAKDTMPVEMQTLRRSDGI